VKYKTLRQTLNFSLQQTSFHTRNMAEEENESYDGGGTFGNSNEDYENQSGMGDGSTSPFTP